MQLKKHNFLFIVLILALISLSGCAELDTFLGGFLSKLSLYVPGNILPTDDDSGQDVGGGILLKEEGRINLELISPYRGQDLTESSVDFTVRITGENADGVVCSSALPQLGLAGGCEEFNTGEADEAIVYFGQIRATGETGTGKIDSDIGRSLVLSVRGYSTITSKETIFNACYKDPERVEDGCRIIDRQGNIIPLSQRSIGGPISVKDVKEELLAGSSHSENKLRFIITLKKQAGAFLFYSEGTGDLNEGKISVSLFGSLLGSVYCGEYQFMEGSNELEAYCVASVSLDQGGGTILDPDYIEPVVVTLEYPYRTSAALSVKI